MKRRNLLVAGIAATAAPFGIAGASASEPVRLANESWSVEIDPATLAIVATPHGRPVVTVSRGVAGHRHDALVQGPGSASWQWDGRFRLTCTLDGPDLSVTVTAAEAGKLALLDQPPGAIGKGLMLPVAEGYYVTAGDARWRSYLTERMEEIDAAEDLSVPLWGLDHGDFTLHWLLADPFDNALRFTSEGDAMAMGLTHEFTSLAPDAPMMMILHLGPADLLAGSKRYRRHLVERGEWRPIADKIAATPAAGRLIGASHLYLWGNGLIGTGDVRDWPGFLTRLGSGTGLAERIRGRFEAEVLALVRAGGTPAPYARRVILRGFNAAITDLARLEWQKEEAASEVLVAAYRTLRTEVVAAFGPVLAKDPAAWGDGLSKAMFADLKAAGLERLWIGLGDGWEGGLWRPEAVRAGAALGYLVAPYDSYETAIPPGERPDWATAQLGRAAYDNCGVVRRDGSITAGFQQTGHYTNTRCVTPILKDRISALAEAGGFNSWFLDVYATGMMFNDYRPGALMTKAENAAANIAACRWLSETMQLPAGSEGGNAVGAPGVLFAHGIATPLFGWGDKELRKDAKSPFFLGNWYPPEGPSVFFKRVPLKQPYLALFFDPATRLPLYQGAFHGSVIVTHQWAFDQLKLANAAADRALLGQLYNIPPLFHLSAETLAARLPAIKRHDAFFRPMHERLAGRTMESFAWLSEDRLVQRTRFDDGTELVANFAGEERGVEGLRLPPRSVTAVVEGKPGRVFAVD